MGVGLPTEDHFREMSRIVAEPIDAGETGLKPPRKEIDGERKAVHFREQRDQKGTEGAERAPIAFAPWLEETKGEDDEHGGVDRDQGPQAVSWNLFAHGALRLSLSASFPAESSSAPPS
jgi:hypothetical protein